MLTSAVLAWFIVSAPPLMYRVTADVVIVEVERNRGVDVGLGIIRESGARVVVGGPEVVVRAFERAGRKTTRGKRFIVTVPGFPARLSATTTIPYMRSIFSPYYYGTILTTVDTIEVGSELEVTARPMGENVSVDVGILESEILDGDTRFLPPQTRAQRVITSVIVPPGSSIVLAGAPTLSSSASGGGGAVIHPTSRGTFVVGGDRGAKEYDMLILLTVTEEKPLGRGDADAMIEEFFNRRR